MTAKTQENTEKRLRIKTELQRNLKPHVSEKTLISARELWLHCVGPDKPISWIRSYKTLLKYVSENYKSIFNPVVIGEGSGTRYYIEIDNVVEFLYKFENHELDN